MGCPSPCLRRRRSTAGRDQPRLPADEGILKDIQLTGMINIRKGAASVIPGDEVRQRCSAAVRQHADQQLCGRPPLQALSVSRGLCVDREHLGSEQRPASARARAGVEAQGAMEGAFQPPEPVRSLRILPNWRLLHRDEPWPPVRKHASYTAERRREVACEPVPLKVDVLIRGQLDEVQECCIASAVAVLPTAVPDTGQS